MFFKPVLQADNFSIIGGKQSFVRLGSSFPYIFEPPICGYAEVVSKSSNTARIAAEFDNIIRITKPGLLVSSDNSSFKLDGQMKNGEQLFELSNLSPNTTYSFTPYVDYYDGPENGQTNSFTTLAEVFGKWTCVWNTTPPNAKLITMTLNSDYTMSQTYYYSNRDDYITYIHTFSLNEETFVFHKDNGDEQTWHIDECTENLLIISQPDGFTYTLVR